MLSCCWKLVARKQHVLNIRPYHATQTLFAYHYDNNRKKDNDIAQLFEMNRRNPAEIAKVVDAQLAKRDPKLCVELLYQSGKLKVRIPQDSINKIISILSDNLERKNVNIKNAFLDFV